MAFYQGYTMVYSEFFKNHFFGQKNGFFRFVIFGYFSLQMHFPLIFLSIIWLCLRLKFLSNSYQTTTVKNFWKNSGNFSKKWKIEFLEKQANFVFWAITPNNVWGFHTNTSYVNELIEHRCDANWTELVAHAKKTGPETKKVHFWGLSKKSNFWVQKIQIFFYLLNRWHFTWATRWCIQNFSKVIFSTKKMDFSDL